MTVPRLFQELKDLEGSNIVKTKVGCIIACCSSIDSCDVGAHHGVGLESLDQNCMNMSSFSLFKSDTIQSTDSEN